MKDMHGNKVDIGIEPGPTVLPSDVFRALAAHYGVTQKALRDTSDRSKPILAIRQAITGIMSQDFGFSAREIAGPFETSHVTALRRASKAASVKPRRRRRT